MCRQEILSSSYSWEEPRYGKLHSPNPLNQKAAESGFRSKTQKKISKSIFSRMQNHDRWLFLTKKMWVQCILKWTGKRGLVFFFSILNSSHNLCSSSRIIREKSSFFHICFACWMFFFLRIPSLALSLCSVCLFHLF